MGRRLAYYVHVDDAWYGPGDKVPADVAKKIGAHAWDDGGPAEAADDPSTTEPLLTGPPPLSGKGSSEDTWRRYAERLGVDVTAAEGRDGVVEAIREAGHPVERSAD